MNQSAFFSPPAIFTERVEELSELESTDGDRLDLHEARILLNVELAFALAEYLGFDDEPVTALWALLSGMLIREERLLALSPAQRLALANVRQIVPYSARFAWIGALRDYMSLPSSFRGYDVSLTEPDVSIIHAAKRPVEAFNQLHANIYRECLTEFLPWHHRKTTPWAKAGVIYRFTALSFGPEMQTLSPTMHVTFREEDLEGIPGLSETWMPPPVNKEPFTVSFERLREVAAILEQREACLYQKIQSKDKPKPREWLSDLEKIRLRLVGQNEPLLTDHLTIDQFTHIAGIVSSGKSTLSILLAAYLILFEPERRMTMVLGDVQSAIRLANQLNSLLCDDPYTDSPVAVPLLGRSTREAQMQGFHGSDDYLQHQERNQFHWGERWLNPLCPLQACLPDSDVHQLLHDRFITTGREPCQILREVPEEKEKDKKGKKRKTNLEERPAKPKRHACPFLPICPQYQLYRDMPGATVWITTPGAMASSTLPVQLESRPLKLGELINEQCDIVIFDEADTIIKWFDDQFATRISLTGGRTGILDTITLPTESHTIGTRVMPAGTLRWVGAERDAQQTVTSVLTLLDNRRGPGFLAKWISGHRFTPLSLFYRLARSIVGLPDYDHPDTPEAERRENDELTLSAMQHFSDFLDSGDPLRINRRSRPSEAVLQLGQLLQRINSTGESATDQDIHGECRFWLREFSPQKGALTSEGLDRLAYKLQFALTVTLLDRHTRIVFYEWDNRPADIQETSPAYRSNTAIRGLLPLPLTGRQFGAYYAHSRNQSDRRPEPAEQNLSLFAYSNVGRYYVLNFHRLFSDLTGDRGPNVLALSGTSYLEASTAFHVSKPQALLLPSEKAADAIRKSEFTFLPQYDHSGKAIRLSGRRQREKPGIVNAMVAGLAGRGGRGQLGQMLKELEQLGKEQPERWADRGRLLLFVNSYEQARWAGEALRHSWPGMQEFIKQLVSDKKEHKGEHEIRRADIEQFAKTNGQILVAPLSAVGRGFNILNQHRKAAFGAVYFLTRPYPHPHDVQALAQELNRRTFDWFDKDSFTAWREDGLQGKAEAARRQAVRYWRLAESRSYYRTLEDDETLCAYPRNDLAATTIGYIIQAVGRLVRGEVPFKAFFVDAAWGPEFADKGIPDSPGTSLLAAMIKLLTDYVEDNYIYRQLYEPLAYALDRIDGFQWQPDQNLSSHA